jgi:arylsulfatase A-like enzyme
VVVVLDTARYGLFAEGDLPLLSARAAAAEHVVNMTNTAGWTGPTTTALISGLRREERYLLGGPEALEEDAVITLTESLSAEGWYTVLFSANVALENWISQGFDEADFSDRETLVAAERFDLVLDTLDAHDEPVFAWLQLMELHVPYGPFAPSCEADVEASAALCPVELFDIGDEVTYTFIDFKSMSESDQAACGAAIHAGQACAARKLDEELDTFLSALPGDTIAVVTTDHGEGWLDPKTDHNWTLNQKISRGFLAVFDAEAEPREYPIASQVDLAPTLLDRLGFDPPPNQYEGVPLGETPINPLKAWRCGTQSLTVETGVWDGDYLGLRVRRPDGKMADELYNTALDPDSDEDLIGLMPMPAALEATLTESWVRTEGLCVEGSDW